MFRFSDDWLHRIWKKVLKGNKLTLGRQINWKTMLIQCNDKLMARIGMRGKQPEQSQSRYPLHVCKSAHVQHINKIHCRKSKC